MRRKLGIFWRIGLLVVLALLVTPQAGMSQAPGLQVYLPIVIRMPDAQALAACIPPGAVMQTGKVTAVVDGDTIRVDIGGQNFVVRYIGIDTPEDTSQREYYGPEATARNRQLVEGKIVRLYKDVSETDRFRRLLRYVYVDNTFINYQLVREGYANVDTYPPDVSCAAYFAQAESDARVEKRGFWANPTPGPQPTLQPTPPPGSEPPVPGCTCTGPDLNCSDFSTQAEAQSCFNYCMAQGYGDVYNLDGDNDGKCCESLP